MTDPQNAFTDAQAVARYAEGPSRNVPGFADLQRMARLLLEEHVPDEGRVIVLGAGGGLELKAFADAHPKWSLLGVDPSSEMLELARLTLGPAAKQVELLQGYIQDAPAEYSHGATCLLTLHFLPVAERRKTIAEVHRRLHPGSPFIVAHLSFPQHAERRAEWLSRYAAFVASSGVEASKAMAAAAAVDKHLTICSPEEDEALLREAGFRHIDLFYAGLAFRGWVAYA